MEIKFRFWQTEENFMLNWIDINPSSLYECLSSKDSIPMQFTGLKDKNGKPIYLKDYLKNPKGEIGKVIYYEAGFYLECPRKGGSIFYIPLTNGFLQNKEIIGNEFESLELIK